LFLPAQAAANPVPPDLASSSDFMLLLSANFVTNLFLFTGLFLLFGAIWRKNVGKLEPDRDRFMLLLLVGVSVITFIGAILDLAFVYQVSFTGIRILEFDGPSWAFAAMLIFGSIYLAAHYLLKIRRRVSILIGAGMVAANLAYWNSMLHDQDDPAFMPLLLLAILPLLLIIMYRWHRTVLAAE
jgi:hypothetical protein